VIWDVQKKMEKEETSGEGEGESYTPSTKRKFKTSGVGLWPSSAEQW